MNRKAWRAVTFGYKLDKYRKPPKEHKKSYDESDWNKHKALTIQTALANADIRPNDNIFSADKPDDHVFFGYEEEKNSVSVKIGEEEPFVFGTSLLSAEKQKLKELCDYVSDYTDLEYIDETITITHAPRLSYNCSSVWVDWDVIGLDEFNDVFKEEKQKNVYDFDDNKRPNYRWKWVNSEGDSFTVCVSNSTINTKIISFQISIHSETSTSILDSEMVDFCIEKIVKYICDICNSQKHHFGNSDWGEFFVDCQSTLRAEKNEVCDVSWLIRNKEVAE